MCKEILRVTVLVNCKYDKEEYDKTTKVLNTTHTYFEWAYKHIYLVAQKERKARNKAKKERILARRQKREEKKKKREQSRNRSNQKKKDKKNGKTQTKTDKPDRS